MPQALVFGASGINGWAVVRECLVYPTEHTFDKVIGLSAKSLDKSQFLLDEKSLEQRLETYGGIDLSSADVVEKIAQLPNIGNTTHVFFAAYSGHNEAYGGHEDPFGHLERTNMSLLNGAITGVTKACPNLEHWSIYFGGKAYGYELLGIPGFLDSFPFFSSLPLKESLTPLPAPWNSMIFYNAQHKALLEASSGKKWTFSEVMPNAVIGYAPRSNPMNLAQPMGLLLSLFREIKGEGSEIAFPGPEAVYNAKLSDTSQDMVAKFAIHAALHGDQTSQQAFNIAEGDEYSSFAELWPEICAYFGLKGTPPKDTSIEPQGVDWVKSEKSKWSGFEEKYGLRKDIFKETAWSSFSDNTKLAMFDRTYDLSKARATGFSESRPMIEAYKTAFDRLKLGKIIP